MGERPIQIFVSYSRQDQEYLEKGSLLGYLRGLEREAGVSFWIDTRRLGAGDAWDAKIRAEIARSDVALLLVSQTFLDSDYCHQVELPGILEQSEKSGLVVVPIILSACDWLSHEWLSSKQVLPGEGKNIESDYRDRGERKELFHEIRSQLRAVVEARREATPAAAGQQAARRQVTVLQCELVATRGSRPLELEEQAETSAAFRRLVAETVGEAGQPIEREGNALVSYFGYPQARGNDARQAVHAALEIADRVAVHRWWARRERRLAARIGVHTGWMAATGEGPLGSPLDRVWEIRTGAEPDSVRVSAETFQLIRGFFSCEAPDDGEGGELATYRVRKPGDGDNRFDLAASEAMTPMVGRKAELKTLLDRFDQLLRGQGGAVLISGENGLGKSRLVRRLTEDFAAEDCAWLIGRGARDFEHSAFRPVHDFLNDIFHFSAGDPPEEKLRKLEKGFDHYALEKDSDLPLLCQLLSVPPGDAYPPLGYSPPRQLERTREVVLDLLLRLAGERPLVLVMEDLDWVDSSTLRLLRKLLHQAPSARLLMLATCTPDFLAAWEPPEHMTRIALERLSDDEAREMILDLPGPDPQPADPQPADLQQRIVEHARGVPLFIEELSRMARESGRREGDSGAPPDLPATFEETVIARFEHLPRSGRELVQLGAVLGRQFSFETLDEASELDASELAPELDRLVEKGLLYRSGSPPRSSYLFKHPWIRAVACAWQSPEERRRHHGQVAEALAASPEVRASQPEILARHFTAAGRLDQAVACRLQAGRRAWTQLATEEAVAHLEQGLELVRSAGFPASADPRGLEHELLTTLGHLQIATEGHASPNVEATFLRSRKLVRPELFEVNWGLATCYLVRTDLERAYAIARELIQMAEMMQDPKLEMEAHTTAGQVRSGQGRNADARHHLEKALVLADAHRGVPSRLATPQDAEVTALGFLGVVAWLEGSPEEALELSRRAVARAQHLEQPFNVALALNFFGFLYQFLDRPQELYDTASSIVAIAAENGFQQWVATGLTMQGWARIAGAEAADPEPAAETLKRMRQALDDYRASGARLAQTFAYSMLIDAWIRQGDLARARATLDEAFEHARDIGDRFWHAELHRLAGEIRLAAAPKRGPGAKAEQAAAEKDFLAAMDLAREQGAVALELRAAESLGRLWERQRKKKEAKELVAEVRGRMPAEA